MEAGRSALLSQKTANGARLMMTQERGRQTVSTLLRMEDKCLRHNEQDRGRNLASVIG
jgi:hypothetical protein